jgi:hypothetical protein
LPFLFRSPFPASAAVHSPTAAVHGPIHLRLVSRARTGRPALLQRGRKSPCLLVQGSQRFTATAAWSPRVGGRELASSSPPRLLVPSPLRETLGVQTGGTARGQSGHSHSGEGAALARRRALQPPHARRTGPTHVAQCHRPSFPAHVPYTAVLAPLSLSLNLTSQNLLQFLFLLISPPSLSL